MLTAVAGIGFCLGFDCLFYHTMYLSVYQHGISKINETSITKLDIEMFHYETWKLIYFGAERSRSQVTKTLPA